MKRYAWIWAVKFLCAALGITAMTVMSRHVIRLEQESRTARLHAEHAEKVRLALWRMESEANAILLLENTRGTKEFLLMPKDQAPDYVRMYFQMDQLSQMKVMEGSSAEDCQQLREIMVGNTASVVGVISNCQAVHQVAAGWNMNTIAWGNSVANGSPEQITQNAEKGKRQESVNRSIAQMKSGNITQAAVLPDQPNQPDATWIAGNFRPVWLAGELFLVRELLGVGGTSMQGVWLRTDALKQRLLELNSDLFANADLRATETILFPVGTGLPAASLGDDLALVSLPWKLQVSETIDVSPIHNSPAMTALRYAWVGLTIAFVAGSVLVVGLMRLSERRATFVSSVTHELRTPLTTFQLYSDMLASGMVKEESKRQGYFETLRREADRLGHLVENVLAFAQVERGSAKGGVREVVWQQMWTPIIERMKTRLEQAGLQMSVEMEDDQPERKVRIDAAALEHILLNLADNAAKYAQPSSVSEVKLVCKADQRGWEVSLRDYGPGIAVADRRKIFRAFHKSAQAAALSKPGVGLGLSLSKRLAKAMGAELTYREGEGGGACFVLRAKWR